MYNATLPVKATWKDRLYASYVSGGQASGQVIPVGPLNPERVFGNSGVYIRDVIRRHIPANRSSVVLDLGCGFGPFVYYLQKDGYQHASGVDISQEQVDLAHRIGVANIRCGNLSDQLKTTPTQSVDVIIAMDVLEHLESEELFDIVDQISRVLKPGGICVAHVPNAEGFFGMRIRYGDLTHERAFAPRSAEQLFKTAGFTDVQCFEDRPLIHGLKSLARRIIWVVGTILPRLLSAAETGVTDPILSQSMLIKARK